MSICSEHQELEPGCPRCYATLPDDFTFKDDLVATKITYEVRAVEIFEIVRKESGEARGSVSTCGQFQSREDAERVAEMLHVSDLHKAANK